MAEKTIKTTIKLRRDTVNNYASHSNHVPLKGEVCIVDPTATAPWATAKNIRIKIGDGTTKWSDLPWLDQENSAIERGYYEDGKFYLDAGHTKQVEPETGSLYLDLHEGIIYYYDDAKNVLTANKVVIPDASAERAGIVRLYTSLGYNEDGTMTQKAITEAIDAIQLVVDEQEPETIFLAKPQVPQADDDQETA